MEAEGQSYGALVSYVTLRRVVGGLGVALPVVVAVWGFVLQGRLDLEDSISAYYDLRTRDAFVGILFVIAWFLFAYRGYEPIDNHVGDLGCACALGVALAPTNGSPIEHALHLGFAAALFFVLAFFCLALFTKTKGEMTPEKRLRNRIYVGCGCGILACMGLIALYFKFGGEVPKGGLGQPVFWLEAAALWFFGASWFVKGQTFFRDAKVVR
jgi:hypothetical protein